MIKNIKSKIVLFASKLKKVALSCLLTTFVALVIVNLAAPIAVRYAQIVEKDKLYSLLLLEPVPTSHGIAYSVVETITITDVTREYDESLCFKIMGRDLRTCAKVPYYFLKEQESQ